MIVIIFLLVLSVIAVQAQEAHQQTIVLSETEIVEIVQSDSLPFSFSQMTAQLRAIIKLDRPLLHQRLWQMLRAWQRLEATRAEIVLLRQVRANLAMVHHLNVEKQKRSEIADLEVLRSQIELIRQDIALLHKQTEYQMTIIELLECGNYLRLDEDKGEVASLRPPLPLPTEVPAHHDEEKTKGK